MAIGLTHYPTAEHTKRSKTQVCPKLKKKKKKKSFINFFNVNILKNHHLILVLIYLSYLTFFL